MSNAMPDDFFTLDEPAYTVSIHIADGIFVKAYKIPQANIGLPQHSHAYSHTSYVATGAVKAWKDGVFVRDVVAPDGILIEAHAKHFFQTIEPNTTILCIHPVAAGEEPEIEDEHVVAVGPSRAALRRECAVDLDGFTFGEELDFDSWLADAQPLFRQHLAATGQDPDGAMLKNVALGRDLAHAGSLMITTARSNARMFAYLVALISPTLDEPGVLTAHLMLPFASPDAPGAGLKLQAATIEMLRARGVTQVYARAGVRGDGPRLGALYKRLGFIDDGALYRLDIKE